MIDTIEQLQHQIETLKEKLGGWEVLSPTEFGQAEIAQLNADISEMEMRLKVMKLVEKWQKHKDVLTKYRDAEPRPDVYKMLDAKVGAYLSLIADLEEVLKRD